MNGGMVLAEDENAEGEEGIRGVHFGWKMGHMFIAGWRILIKEKKMDAGLRCTVFT